MRQHVEEEEDDCSRGCSRCVRLCSSLNWGEVAVGEGDGADASEGTDHTAGEQGCCAACWLVDRVHDAGRQVTRAYQLTDLRF